MVIRGVQSGIGVVLPGLTRTCRTFATMSPADLATRYIDAFNRRDWPTMYSMLSDDIRYVTSGDLVASGRAEVEQYYAPFFNTDVEATVTQLAAAEQFVFFEVALTGSLADGTTYALVSAVRQEWLGDQLYAYRAYPDPPVIDGERVSFDEFRRRAATGTNQP
jgi:ketosteroid isomerase-like protein